MERWIGRVALVTGVSSGIGAAIASLLVKRGMTVVGCARNVGSIQKLAGELQGEKGQLYTIRCDLTKEAEILRMFQEIKERHGGVDVCVNNAGLAHNAPLLTTSDTTSWRNMLDVNVMALSICTREAYQSMKARGVDDGHIININSIAGKRVRLDPSGHFYAASKFAVSALSEGVRNELQELDSHIRISQISPGFVETNFHYQKFGAEVAKKIYSRIECLQAEDIAAAFEYILSAPPHVQVHDVMIMPTEQN